MRSLPSSLSPVLAAFGANSLAWKDYAMLATLSTSRTNRFGLKAEQNTLKGLLDKTVLAALAEPESDLFGPDKENEFFAKQFHNAVERHVYSFKSISDDAIQFGRTTQGRKRFDEAVALATKIVGQFKEQEPYLEPRLEVAKNVGRLLRDRITLFVEFDKIRDALKDYTFLVHMSESPLDLYGIKGDIGFAMQFQETRKKLVAKFQSYGQVAWQLQRRGFDARTMYHDAIALSNVLLGSEDDGRKPYPWRCVSESILPILELRVILFVNFGRHALALNDYATLYALSSNRIYPQLRATREYEKAMNNLNDANILGLSELEARNRKAVSKNARDKTKPYHPDKVTDALDTAWCHVYFTRVQNAKDRLLALYHPSP